MKGWKETSATHKTKLDPKSTPDRRIGRAARHWLRRIYNFMKCERHEKKQNRTWKPNQQPSQSNMSIPRLHSPYGGLRRLSVFLNARTAPRTCPNTIRIYDKTANIHTDFYQLIHTFNIAHSCFASLRQRRLNQFHRGNEKHKLTRIPSDHTKLIVLTKKLCYPGANDQILCNNKLKWWFDINYKWSRRQSTVSTITT